MRTLQTRLKLVCLGIVVSFFEGLIKAFLPEFPLIEVFAVQNGLILAYITGRSYEKKFSLSSETNSNLNGESNGNC